MQIIPDIPFHYYLIIRAVEQDMPGDTTLFTLGGRKLNEDDNSENKALIIFPDECSEENIKQALSNGHDSVFIAAYTGDGIKHRDFLETLAKKQGSAFVTSSKVKEILDEKKLDFISKKAVSTNTYLYSSLFAKLKRTNPVFVSFSNYLKENFSHNELNGGEVFEIFRINPEKEKIFDKDIALLINCSAEAANDLDDISSKMPSNLEVFLFGEFSNKFSDDYRKIGSLKAAHALFKAREVISAKYYILADISTDINYHVINKLIAVLEESKKALIASPRLVYKNTPYVYFNGAEAGFYKDKLTVYHRDNLKEESFLRDNTRRLTLTAIEDMAAVSNVLFDKIKISPDDLIEDMEFIDLCMHVCVGNPFEIIAAGDIIAESNKAIPRGKPETEHGHPDEFTAKWKDLFIPEKDEKETSMDLWEIWSRRELIFNPEDIDSLKLLYGNALRNDNHSEARKWKALLDEAKGLSGLRTEPGPTVKSSFKDRISNIINRVNELNRSDNKKLAAEIVRILFGRIIKPAELKKKETLALINEEKLSKAETLAESKSATLLSAAIESLSFNPVSVGALPYSAKWSCPACGSTNIRQLTGTALSESEQVCSECGSKIIIMPNEYALEQLSNKFSTWEPDIFIRKITLDHKKEDGVDLDQNLRFLINSYLASLIND